MANNSFVNTNGIAVAGNKVKGPRSLYREKERTSPLLRVIVIYI